MHIPTLWQKRLGRNVFLLIILAVDWYTAFDGKLFKDAATPLVQTNLTEKFSEPQNSTYSSRFCLNSLPCNMLKGNFANPWPGRFLLLWKYQALRDYMRVMTSFTLLWKRSKSISRRTLKNFVLKRGKLAKMQYAIRNCFCRLFGDKSFCWTIDSMKIYLEQNCLVTGHVLRKIDKINFFLSKIVYRQLITTLKHLNGEQIRI